jgi:hypothetical protein
MTRSSAKNVQSSGLEYALGFTRTGRVATAGDRAGPPLDAPEPTRRPRGLCEGGSLGGPLELASGLEEALDLTDGVVHHEPHPHAHPEQHFADGPHATDGSPAPAR